MEEDQNPVNDDDVASSSTLKWRIENVSKLNEENHFSPIFVIGPHKWCLVAFRRGCNVNGYLSVYVVALECKNSRHAKFSLAIIDQTNYENTLRKDTEGEMIQFTDDENDWGFDEFIQIKELEDPSNWFIVNDVCVIEAELCITSTQESKEKLGPDEIMESDEEKDPVTLLASTSCLDNNSAFICAFCQTSKVSEDSGSMLRFANGKELEEDKVSGPNVIHVHVKCLMWAPQVYYVGETLKNLELEVVRGSKLKCSCCGLKGAALGCFEPSCKNTYHVLCAFGTSDCRWYDEGYLILCPSHSDTKFPHEKAKKKKKLASDISSSVHRKSWQATAIATNKLVLCGSSLSAEEKHLLANFAKISGVTVSENMKPNVTHLITSTDEKGACRRTFRYLKAILDGKWVLKIDWIKACTEARDLADEEPYEVELDIDGCRDGPRNGRLRASEGAPKLFNGLHFYFTGEFVPLYKKSLEGLVVYAGARVLTKNSLLSRSSDEGDCSSTTLIVYDFDEEVSFTVLLERRREAEALGKQSRSVVIGHTWILESIAALKLEALPRGT
ncbi:hypothetical protein MKX03_025554 [Papaver bracteatum]|nr:hypothetical protein MKX03_025554 [Papaver bracteatum]